ncbi:MAG: hypothetical protein AAFQ64_03855 [Pseudomonadota bacterium]
MLSDFGLGLIIPATLLAAIAWLVPIWLRWRMPEGVRPLMMLSALATLVVLSLGALVFLGLYLLQGASLSTLTSAGIGPAVWYFLRLSISAGLIWAPILVLSIAGLPKTWVHETW